MDQDSNFLFKGSNITLVEIEESDTEFLVELRNKHARFLQATPLTLESHRQFLKYYKASSSDLYGVAWTNEAEGLQRIGSVAIHDIDHENHIGEFGRQVVLPQFTLYAVEMSYGILKYAFEQIGLRTVVGKIQAKNRKSIQFNMKLGFRHKQLIRNGWNRTNLTDDLVVLEMTTSDFQGLKRSVGHFCDFR